MKSEIRFLSGCNVLFLKTCHLVLVATCIFLPDDDANGALYECHVSILYLLTVITFFFIAIGCHYKQHSLFLVLL